MTDKRVSEMTDAEIQQLAGARPHATFAVVDIATGWLDTSELEEHLAVIPMTDAAKTIIDVVDGRLAKLLKGRCVMAAEDSQRCAWPPCGRLVERPATGRPGRYCGSNCRQSDYRERVRQAGAERDRAAQLARAEAEAAVVAYASGPADTRAGLADVLYRLRTVAGQLEGLAVGYRDAIDTAARLTGQ